MSQSAAIPLSGQDGRRLFMERQQETMLGSGFCSGKPAAFGKLGAASGCLCVPHGAPLRAGTYTARGSLVPGRTGGQTDGCTHSETSPRGGLHKAELGSEVILVL